MQKIAPRDIFNDANYYKNLSYLFTYMKNGIIKGIEFTLPSEMIYEKDFLKLNPEDGGLHCPDDAFYFAPEETTIVLERPMNSREAFPVYFSDNDYNEFSVFDDSGMPHPEILDMTSEADSVTFNPQIDPQSVMAYSIALKGIGKLALQAIDRLHDVNKITFDEAQYSQEGLILSEEGAYFYLENEDLVMCDGEPVTLRSPSITSEDNLWPLEFAISDGDFSPVYTPDGKLSQDFLAISSSPEMAQESTISLERTSQKISR